MREVAPDSAADAKSAEARLAREQVKAEKARARAKKSYERRRDEKNAKKGSSAQRKSAPPRPAETYAEAAAASSPEDGPLGAVLNEAAAAGAAAPTAEEAAAAAVLEQLGSPEKFAAFMARMQKVAEVAATRIGPSAMKVVKALDWAEADGAPTPNILMAVQLAWPWLDQGGFEFLALLGPGFMAALGGGLAFGPAIVVGMGEYEQHKLERLERQKKAAGEVIELDPQKRAN